MTAKAKKKQAKKAKGSKKGNAASAKQEPRAKTEGKRGPAADLAALKKTAQEAKDGLEKARKETVALRARAKDIEAAAKQAYGKAVAPYREACRKAGSKCEFAGSRAPNVAPAVRFLVEKVPNGIKVAIKGQPDTEEVVPAAKLKESIGRAAFDFCERKLGPESQYGKKWAGLSNRFRSVLAKK
jgi:hypothetical protein